VSTNIYNGFVLDTQHAGEIMTLCTTFRQWLKDREFDPFERLLKVVFPDGNITVEEAKREADWYREQHEEMRRTNRRDPRVDGGDFALTFFPVPFKNYTIGIVYTDESDWRDAWYAQDEVEHYGWWDGSDRPDDVSLKTWTRRKHDWNDVLKPEPGIPMECGLSIRLTSQLCPELWRWIERRFPGTYPHMTGGTHC
jgi:hypothetical protein